MPFEPGHKKQGGRTAGTPNKASGEAREVARRLLGDAEYQRSLRKRLIRGEAPRIELHLWEVAYGKPGGEPDDAPEGAGPTADLVQILEKLGDPNRQGLAPPLPRVVDPHDSDED
jgi:hypothetical protein